MESETVVSAKALRRTQAAGHTVVEELQYNEQAPTHNAQTGGYRPDIDGLRAIAVLLVLIFHGGSSVFSSGFIGVDMFFVISGFLITSIVMKDVSAKTFSFAKFYARRAWRLQPAMIAMYVATLVIAALVYLPADFVEYLKSGKYASMFLANQYFERTTTAYAADDTASLLLLHTWSLAIEWQWYFLLPVCLVVLSRRVSASALKIITPLAAMIAAGVALTLSSLHPDNSYYFFVARIFELLVGACVVVLNGDTLKLGKIQASLIGLVSLALIFYCSTRAGIVRGFPDYHALLVCLATAVLLIKSVGEKSIHGALIASVLPRSLGKISYSLYLWHWPVLAVIAYLGMAGQTYAQLAYYLVSLLLAVASYRLIEKPFRRCKWGLLPALLILVITPAVLFSIAYKVADSQDGMPWRFGPEYAASQSNLAAYELKNRRYCMDGATDGSDPRCVVGDVQSPTRALLIGDSFANQYMGFMDVLGKDSGISVTALSTSACLSLPDVYLYDWWKFKDTLYYACHDRAVDFYNLIKTGGYKYVVLGQIWANYAQDNVVHGLSDERSVELSRARLMASMHNALDIIVQSGATPVIIKTVQTMPAGVNECLSRHLKLRDALDSRAASAQCASTPQTPRSADWSETLFAALKRDFPGLRLIDPTDVQCQNGSCATVLAGVPVYRDVGHITDFASRKLGELYLKQSGDPLR